MSNGHFGKKKKHAISLYGPTGHEDTVRQIDKINNYRQKWGVSKAISPWISISFYIIIFLKPAYVSKAIRPRRFYLAITVTDEWK